MNITKKLVDTLTWAASSDVQVDLPTEGLITEIDIECSITGSGALNAALSVEGLWRVIQSLKIEGGGGKVYYGLAGTQMGLLLHYLNLLDYPGSTWRDIVATTQNIGWRIHFGSRPRDIFGRKNPFDLSVAIPAFAETNLKFIWTTTAATAINDNTTISSGTMRLTVHEVLGGEKAWSKMIPVSSSESYDPGATKSDFQAQRDVPTGNFVRRIAIMALDATAYTSVGPLLKNDQMTEVGILLNKENRWLIQAREQALRLGGPVLDGGNTSDTPNTMEPYIMDGRYVLDLRQYDNPDYGLNTKGLQTGDVKLGMTIGAYASAEKEHIWYDQVQQWPG